MNKPRKKIAKNDKPSGNIRIIAGKYRGRKLPVLASQGLRPTTDRIKETVFNWLMPYINGSRCLDCFSGAGSLGFEAASRGASTVCMLELDKQAAAQLQQNKALLQALQCDIQLVDTLEFMKKKPSQPFDIIFIDPPFHQQLLPKVFELLTSDWLNKNALIYVEKETNATNIITPPNWQLLKEKSAGQVSFQLFQVI